jgi:hypothetical protein
MPASLSVNQFAKRTQFRISKFNPATSLREIPLHIGFWNMRGRRSNLLSWIVRSSWTMTYGGPGNPAPIPSPLRERVRVRGNYALRFTLNALRFFSDILMFCLLILCYPDPLSWFSAFRNPKFEMALFLHTTYYILPTISCSSELSYT